MGQTLPQPYNIACSAFCDTMSFSPINWICFNLRILPKIRKMTRLMWISSNFSTLGSKLKNPLDRTQCYHVLSNCTLPFVQNGSPRRGRTEHLSRVKLPYKSSLCYCMCQNCDKSTWILIWKYIFGGLCLDSVSGSRIKTFGEILMIYGRFIDIEPIWSEIRSQDRKPTVLRGK